MVSFKPIIKSWCRRTSPWGGIAASVVGNKHIAEHRPNQDCARFALAPGGRGSAAAVADGHSMAVCCRAHLGSEYAAEIAVEALVDWIESRDSGARPSVEAAVDLSEVITAKWYRRIRGHIGQNTWTPKEVEILGPCIATPAIAYGTTLVAVAATDAFLLGLQIGDGQLFAVTPMGVSGQLIAPIEQEGERSDSLCAPDALAKFRFALELIAADGPPVLVCTTDGYDKAFRTTGDFLQVGSMILDHLRTVGPDVLATSLPANLQEASVEGSQDDVSCAILYRKDQFNHVRTR